MKRALTVLALILAVSLMTAGQPIEAEGCDSQSFLCQQIQQGQNQQSQEQNRLDQINSQIKDANAKDLALAQLIKQVQAQIETQKGLIQQTQKDIDSTERSIRFTGANLTRGQAHVAVRDQLLGQRLRTLSKQDNTDYLAVLVSSQSFTQLIDRVSLMRNVIKSDEEMVSGLTQDQQRITDLQNQLDDQRNQLNGLLQEQQQQQKNLEQELGLQEQALAAQKQLEDQLAQQREEMESEIAQVSGDIAAWEQQYQSQIAQLGGGSSSSGSGGGGSFVWPIGARWITQPFGCTDLVGEPWMNPPGCYFHTGLDIAGSNGSSIWAAARGVVVFTGWRGGYGNSVIVQHSGGYTTTYNHLSSIAVSKGQTVSQGQVVGYEGSTGFSTGPHLHFEILYNGNFQNPSAYL